MSALAIARRRKSISLTPLIDVVFILLMFFMLSSSFQRYQQIDLESPNGVATTTTAPLPQLVLLNAEGAVSVHESEFYLAHYSALTSVHLPQFPQRTAVLLPDSNVAVQDLLATLENLRALGLEVALGNSLPVPP